MVYRILLFYIGSLVVLLALYPWVEIKSDSSPFVMIFHNLDSNPGGLRAELRHSGGLAVGV